MTKTARTPLAMRRWQTSRRMLPSVPITPRVSPTSNSWSSETQQLMTTMIVIYPPFGVKVRIICLQRHHLHSLTWRVKQQARSSRTSSVTMETPQLAVTTTIARQRQSSSKLVERPRPSRTRRETRLTRWTTATFMWRASQRRQLRTSSARSSPSTAPY